MFGIGFVILGVVTTGGIAFLLVRWQEHWKGLLPPKSTYFDAPNITPTPVAYEGRIQMDTLTQTGISQIFDTLSITPESLQVHYHDGTALWIPLDTVHLVFVPTEAADHFALATLYIEREQRLRTVHLQLKPQELQHLLRMLRHKLPAKRLVAGTFALPSPFPIRFAHETALGEWILGNVVNMLLLPDWIILMHDDVIYDRIYIREIRQVVTIDRKALNPVQSGMRWLMNRPKAGVIKLIMDDEVFVYAAENHHQLGAQIAYDAHCPIEQVYHQRKKKSE